MALADHNCWPAVSLQSSCFLFWSSSIRSSPDFHFYSTFFQQYPWGKREGNVWVEHIYVPHCHCLRLVCCVSLHGGLGFANFPPIDAMSMPWKANSCWDWWKNPFPFKLQFSFYSLQFYFFSIQNDVIDICITSRKWFLQIMIHNSFWIWNYLFSLQRERT